jgi:ABC-2 type transport system permease protein
MPIHDQSYRRYTGTRRKPGSAWAVIASTGLRSLMRKKFFVAVMLFSWLQFLVRAVMIYLAANFPQMDVIAPSSETFRNFFEQQGSFVLFVAVYVGAGLIATDRRVHALQIYLSKPLTRAEYIAGKLAILMGLLLLVTWVPAMLLLVVQVMFAGDLVFLRENLFLVPAITVFGFLYAIVVSFAMLALSSLSTSARFVGVLYVGVLLFTGAVATVMNLVTGGSALSWLSFRANLAQVGDVIFRMPPRYESSWAVSLAVILCVIVVSALVLERRVRGVEVVT